MKSSWKLFVISSGYRVQSVSVVGTYKNLKGPSDVEAENTYRITKVNSDLTITVNTQSI